MDVFITVRRESPLMINRNQEEDILQSINEIAFSYASITWTLQRIQLVDILKSVTKSYIF
jgi:hypothetical protein